MNEIDEFKKTELIDGPGTILRRAREAKGLDVAAVAAMLHLSEFKINAMEADDFDSLPEPVFVRGYLKNYARLLEEPVGPVLDAYAKFGYEPDIPEQTLVDSDVEIEVNGDHDLVKIISIAVVVALIVVPIIIWWDDLGQVAQKLVTSGETEQPELAIPVPIGEQDGASKTIALPTPSDNEMTNETTVVAEDKDRITSTIQLKPAQPPVESVIQEIEPSDTESKSIALPLPSTTDDEAKPTTEIAPEPVATPVVSPPSKPDTDKTVPGVQGVWFKFVDTGWVKVRDARNRVILIGEHKKGTRKKLTSIMPYKVVLGNSNAVQVEIDGKQANIERFSSGGVARFTINDGKIEKP